MYRNLKSGGALIVTSAGPNTVLYGEEEEPPANYHALGTEELKALLPPNAFYDLPNWLCANYTRLGIFWREEVRAALCDEG